MEKMTGFEVETTTYNREIAKDKAQAEAYALLDERMPGVNDLPAAEKIPVLRELIAELSVTIEGGDIPQHNEYRHVVESLAGLLRVSEIQSELESVMSRYPELA